MLYLGDRTVPSSPAQAIIIGNNYINVPQAFTAFLISRKSEQTVKHAR